MSSSLCYSLMLHFCLHWRSTAAMNQHGAYSNWAVFNNDRSLCTATVDTHSDKNCFGHQIMVHCLWQPPRAGQIDHTIWLDNKPPKHHRYLSLTTEYKVSLSEYGVIFISRGLSLCLPSSVKCLLFELLFTVCLNGGIQNCPCYSITIGLQLISMNLYDWSLLCKSDFLLC